MCGRGLLQRIGLADGGPEPPGRGGGHRLTCEPFDVAGRELDLLDACHRDAAAGGVCAIDGGESAAR